jgi:hypothetical protein
MIGAMTIGDFAHAELNDVMTAKTIDEISGRAFGDDLAMIDDSKAIAKALGLVHVMRGQQDRAA